MNETPEFESAPDDTSRVQITVHFDRVLAAFSVAIRRASQRVSATCAGLAHVQPGEVGAFAQRAQIVFSEPGPTDQGQIEDAQHWVVGCGVRDLADALNDLLLHLFRFAAFGEACASGDVVVEAPQGREKIPILELIDLIVGRKVLRSVARYGVDRKLKEFEKQYGIQFSSEESLKSFGAIRNCFAHRNGVVGSEDCGPPDREALVLDCRRLELQATEPGCDSMPIEFGRAYPAGASLSLHFKPFRFEWKRGERIELDEAGFETLAFNVLELGRKATQSIEAYYVLKGLKKPPAQRDSDSAARN